MKKISGILLLIAVMAQSLSAQDSQTEEKKEGKNAWFDLQVTQHIGLNQWSSASYVNDGFPKTALTEFRGVVNIDIVRSYAGIFGDMSVGIMPAPKMNSLALDRMPMPHQGTQYYLRDILSEPKNSGTSAHFKMTFGLFGNIPANEKLAIMPYFGVGFFTMPEREYEALLKEQGSNMQYKTMYAWNSDSNGHAKTLGYLSGRLNFKYRLSQKSNLLLGLEYTYFLEALDFYAKYTNTFNANIQRDFSIKGNKVNMLGVSVGLSFM